MNHNFLKIAVPIIVVLIVIASLAFFAFPKAEQKTINVSYLPSNNSLPLFVAIERGWFEEAGLKVNLMRIESPKDIIDGLINGNIDAGSPATPAGITTVVESQNPGALKVFALNCEYKDQLIDEILVPVDSQIKSISELKGKKIAHIPGVQWQTLTKKILMVNGINPDDVTLIELSFANQLPALASHSIDAVVTLEPTGAIGISKNAAKVFVKAPVGNFVVNPLCPGAGVLSAKFINSNPVEAKKFVEIIDRAMAETNTVKENRQLLVKYLQLPQKAVDSADIPVFYSAKDFNSEIVSAYQEFADLFFELKVTKKKINVQDLFWNQ